MNGLLARLPYPSESMSDAIVVTASGSTLLLAKGDPAIQTQDPTTGQYRPSMAGDVLSRTGGKIWEGRPSGSNGPWEQFATNGVLAVYDATGDVPTAEGFVYWPNVPNL